MKILIAADGSAFTKRMLAYLAAHDEWMGPQHQYTVLTVVPSVPPRAAAAMARGEVEAYYGEEAEKVFTPIRAFFGQQGKPLTVDYLPRHGHAADVIAQQATQGRYDLLVLGSHGHGSLGNLVMGSVATRVVAQCGVPVLLVR
jgi:nucleotide-binding universal stress UspA family protein